jgi:predicted AAA+ superfamily ATPase
MVNRRQKLSKNNNLFLFGARGTGKTTLLKKLFGDRPNILWIDLLSEEAEEKFGRHPDELSNHLKEKHYDYIIIDEIQKFPKLLDIVHLEIEKKDQKIKSYFILTGSSARKLKRNAANLLGGRAFNFLLFPYTHLELDEEFNLDLVLKFGSLPLTWAYEDNELKAEFLRGYVKNYIKEEILEEQIVRRIDTFRDFLEVAAQNSGDIINYSKIARDVGTSDQTVKSFYQVMEDTLIGFSLPSFHRSIRKRQREAPKFYLFDLGVKSALERTLKIPLEKRTSSYRKAFEHFIVLEIFRMCEYLKNDFRLSYLRTKDDAEIDLVIERPGRPDLLLEIKSIEKVGEDDVRTVSRFSKEWDKEAEGQVWSQDVVSKKINNVSCYDWREGFSKLFPDD